MNYDLIGDIHGHSKPLTELLTKLGYRMTDSVYRHPDRQAIFLGDFIDRGPRQREVIDIVRPMIDSGAAMSVMGNHEFNAVAYFTEDPDNPGHYLRARSDKHRRQHQVFLDAYEGADDYPELIKWFQSLPLWLDLPGLRVVHACWDPGSVKYVLGQSTDSAQLLNHDLLVNASRKGSVAHEAIEILLKGREVEIPNGQTFPDREGHARNHIRVKWWDATARNYRAAFLGPDFVLSHIPKIPIDIEHLSEYSTDEPPVFIGHYWMDTEPGLMSPNVACLDYSVAARGGGKLVAYRWDGEQELSDDKFVYVLREG